MSSINVGVDLTQYRDVQVWIIDDQVVYRRYHTSTHVAYTCHITNINNMTSHRGFYSRNPITEVCYGEDVGVEEDGRFTIVKSTNMHMLTHAKYIGGVLYGYSATVSGLFQCKDNAIIACMKRTICQRICVLAEIGLDIVDVRKVITWMMCELFRIDPSMYCDIISWD